MTITAGDIGEAIGRKLGKDRYKAFAKDHLTSRDYEMFDRIFEQIDYIEKYGPTVYYVEHFALQQNWKPNANKSNNTVLQTKTKADASGKERLKPSIPSVSFSL